MKTSSCIWFFGSCIPYFCHSFFYAVYLLLLPCYWGFQRIMGLRPVLKTLLMSLLIVLVLVNLKIVSAYDNCCYGNGPWDVSEWLDLLLKPIYVK